MCLMFPGSFLEVCLDIDIQYIPVVTDYSVILLLTDIAIETRSTGNTSLSRGAHWQHIT